MKIKDVRYQAIIWTDARIYIYIYIISHSLGTQHGFVYFALFELSYICDT